jgi:hypothetical protein
MVWCSERPQLRALQKGTLKRRRCPQPILFESLVTDERQREVEDAAHGLRGPLSLAGAVNPRRMDSTNPTVVVLRDEIGRGGRQAPPA